jgi:hypothetical protein
MHFYEILGHSETRGVAMRDHDFDKMTHATIHESLFAVVTLILLLQVLPPPDRKVSLITSLTGLQCDNGSL